MRVSTGRKFKRLLFAATTVILLFAVLEYIARVVNLPARPLAKNAPMSSDEYSVEDPEIFWLMKPNIRLKEDTVWVETNNLGLRDDDVIIPKPSNTIRILCLGESTTFGANVPQNETYAQIAEEKLNSINIPGVRFDVINAGMSASSSFQAWQWVLRFGKAVEPDAVVLYYQTNDTMPCFVRAGFLFDRGFDYTDRQLYELRNRYRGTLFFFERSMLYKTLRHIITGRMAQDMQLRLTRFVDSESEQSGHWPMRVPPRDRVWVWNNFAKWTKQNNSRLALMNPCYSTSAPQVNLPLTWAYENHVPILNCVTLLKESAAPWDELFKLKIDTHPSPVAHRIIGEALGDFLLPVLADHPLLKEMEKPWQLEL